MAERGTEGTGGTRLGLPFVALFPVLLGVAGMAMSSSRVSASASFAAAVALVLLTHIGVVHRTSPRAVVVAAVGTLVWAVPVAIGDAMAIGSTLVDVQEKGPKCGTGLMGLAFVALPFGLVVLVAAGVCLSVLAADRARDRAIHELARISAALGAIVVAVSLFGLGRADPDTYFDTLRRHAVLEEGEGIRLGGHDLRYEHVHPTDGADVMQIEECKLTGVVGAALPVTAYGRYPLPGERCPSMGIFLDPRGDLAFVRRLDAPWASSKPTIAFRVADAAALRLTASDLADRLAAPIGWRIAGAASVLLALPLLVAARRLRRRAGALAGRDAHHHGGGCVALGDGMAPLFCPVAVPLPVGPIVLLGEQERPATYREVPVPSFRAARAGSLEASRVSLRDFAAALAAIALAVVVLGVTPLVVARVCGV